MRRITFTHSLGPLKSSLHRISAIGRSLRGVFIIRGAYYLCKGLLAFGLVCSVVVSSYPGRPWWSPKPLALNCAQRLRHGFCFGSGIKNNSIDLENFTGLFSLKKFKQQLENPVGHYKCGNFNTGFVPLQAQAGVSRSFYSS